MKLIIHAPNVHRGGGWTLLLGLLETPVESGPRLLIADERLEIPASLKNTQILRFPPTLSGRIAAEQRLQSLAQTPDVVLCLGNLPPLFQLRARRVVLFIQNRYLLEAVDTSAFAAIVRLRIAVERQWLRRRIRRVHQIIVQSPSMAEAVHRCLGIRPEVAPFAALDSGNAARATKKSPAAPDTAGFLYVASGEPHKNHRRLVEAWLLLAEAGIRPLLRLTLNTAHHPELVEWIAACRERCGLRIENSGEVSPEQLARFYEESAALIYPSLTESLGLPLLEARAHGLPILAPERDFVRDIVTPRETFDPESPRSIARAVRRFLGADEAVLQIRTPSEFLDLVQGG